ncbi:hypothetical protein L1987_46935 [Smallanthus sonchifolius]|uniref:Uncharacterized protein n=1 Tax=Smallanthus sonchifolius TaxID=185202 RepID=A0ACB9G1N7_9ASTR|nr:hypothetical protein L1987_46935 [Smallanthus sonchifolius]
MFDSSFLLRKVNQASGAAILAVGGRVPGGVTSPGLDMRSNYPSYENYSNRLRLLVQRSFAQQNMRFNELGGDKLSFPQRADSYGVPSRIIDQTLPNNTPPQPPSPQYFTTDPLLQHLIHLSSSSPHK